MTDLATLLADLTARGVLIEAHGDRLKIDAPADVLTAELRAALAEHKAALLAHLAGDAAPTPAPPAILHRIPLDIDCTPSEWLAARGLRVVGGTSHFGGARRPVLFVVADDAQVIAA
jgi:hypothetical protein